MKPFLYYFHQPDPTRVHVAGAVPNEENRRNTQLKNTELTYRTEVAKAIKASHRWFSNSVYKYLEPQQNAFDRLATAITGLNNYQIDSIHPVETHDDEQFGMAFRCSKVVTPERTAHFQIRVGLFKDIIILSPAYKNQFPIVSSVGLLQEHPSHPTNELKELLDSLGATLTYSSMYGAYEYYTTPEGYVYHISVINPMG